MIVTIERARLLRMGVGTKSLSDIPNYAKATTAEACNNCRWFRRGWCIKFKVKVSTSYTCDDWQETVKKEVSSTPTAVYGHGADGLFSMPGLGKREKQTPLQRAIALKEKYSHKFLLERAKHLSGKHNQSSHGRGTQLAFDFGKKPEKVIAKRSHLPTELENGLNKLEGRSKELAQESLSSLSMLERSRSGAIEKSLLPLPESRRDSLRATLTGDDKALGEKKNMFQRRRANIYRDMKAVGMSHNEILDHPNYQTFNNFFTPLNDEFNRRRQYYNTTRRLVALNEGRKKGKPVFDESDISGILSKKKDAYRESGWNGKGKHPYSPELFRKSDLSGKRVRYFVTLPDGRIAHPDELLDARSRGRIIKVNEIKAPRRMDWSIEVQSSTKSRLDYARSLKHLTGQHDQKRHAYRYGKNLNLARARAIRKGGNWGDYKKRARGDKTSPKKQPKQPSKKKRAETKAFGQDPNVMYTFRNRVVDLDDLITSNTSTGAINPNYDKALQPRDRTRQGSQQQVDNVAKNLVPESLLFDFHQIDRGTPIVGDDMMVESGNGRSMALKRAKEQYPEQWANYQSKLRENLTQNGLDESDLKGIKNPVIVRERLSKVNRTEFAKEANQANVLQMSPLERAKNDAKTMKDSSLFNMTMGDDQSIDQALRSPKNSRFVQEFLGDLPDTERASLMRANGTLNQMGLFRMKAAIFSKTFPGEAGERLADTFLEGLDSTTKNFEKSIVRTLPKLAKAESLINSGQRPKVSIMTDASKALDMLARLRENNVKVPDYLRQGSLFSRELTPKQEQLLAHFNQIGKSTVFIRNFFNTYADAVINLQNPKQMGLFGQALPNQDDIFAILQAQGVL